MVKLEIITVEPPKPFGQHGAQQIRFKARSEEGKELQYFTTAPSLFPLIVPGPISCDVETKQREYSGNTYTDRKVIEVYRDGQPVKGQQQPSGGRSYGKPMEQVQFERASIEFNSALMEAGLGVREGKAPKDIEDTYWGHLRRLLTARTPPPMMPVPLNTTKDTRPPTIPEEAGELDRDFADTARAAAISETPRQFSNRGTFAQAAFNELGLSPSQINKILGIEKDGVILNLSEAWKQLVAAREAARGGH